jgi:SAM-dependent methyltransferase
MSSYRSYLRTLHNWVTILGVNPLTTLRTIRGLPFYFHDLRLLLSQRRKAAAPFSMGPAFVCVGEKFGEGGTAKGHYFHQDLLVAQRIHLHAPERHLDVGSRIDGFVAHVASFRPIEVMDIRPIRSQITNLRFVQGDLMKALPADLAARTDSLSCLHALEHFGLGRYGDPIDHDGYLKGLENLAQMLRPAGRLYLSVPIGPQRIEFNAHRVFSVAYMLELLSKHFDVTRFAFVDDDGDLHDDVPLEASAVMQNFGCRYGCGIFEAHRKPSFT